MSGISVTQEIQPDSFEDITLDDTTRTEFDLEAFAKEKAEEAGYLNPVRINFIEIAGGNACVVGIAKGKNSSGAFIGGDFLGPYNGGFTIRTGLAIKNLYWMSADTSDGKKALPSGNPARTNPSNIKVFFSYV